LDASSSTSSSRLSRDHLLGAEVIAQVDRKFILVKAWSSSASSLTHKTSNTMLVLIDQHAADERIRVEALFQELCAPVSPNSACSGYRSKLGYSARVASTLLDKPVQFMVSQQERIHFTTHAQSFARWGILYDALASLTPEIAAKDQDTLSVTALPPSISERCKSDAGLLISFLRSTMWKYASDSHRVPSASFAEDETPNWVQRLASCPDGLVEMVNSRACRSAIMFNDELNLEECKHLVQKLAACVFPFMCAHGRPSMIPLVLTERSGDSPNNSEPDRCEKTAHFVQAWKQWKR
jgi:DNA mismatch repair protein MLH3